MHSKLSLATLATAALVLAACGSQVNPGSSNERQLLRERTQASLRDFTATDPTLQPLIDSSYAYAIFPHITKAGVGVGGAHGNGEVYRGGRFVGWADMSQASVGAQLGAQTYAELILFRNETPYINFTQGTYEFNAGVSAVAASAGAAKTADYTNGVAVFTKPEGGLMAAATIGGQKFRFTPANQANQSNP